MPSRYEKYSRRVDNIYQFTLYPSVEVNDIDFHKVTTQYGQRLDLLAAKYFDNSKLWWVIAMINDIQGDSIVVPTGTQLYIPRQVTKYVY